LAPICEELGLRSSSRSQAAPRNSPPSVSDDLITRRLRDIRHAANEQVCTELVAKPDATF